MKFIVDAHQPQGLCALLKAAGHDALHTSQLPLQNRTPDHVINELSENSLLELDRNALRVIT